MFCSFRLLYFSSCFSENNSHPLPTANEKYVVYNLFSISSVILVEIMIYNNKSGWFLQHPMNN